MPESDNYQSELIQLREGLGSGVVTIESNGRRKTYRSVGEIEQALKIFERVGGTRRRRRSRFRLASIGSE